MALLPFVSETEETNAVDLLRRDHEKVKALFREFETAGAADQKQSLVQQALTEPEMHASVEEDIFYPAVRQDWPNAAQRLDQALEEHHVAKFLMRELKALSPEDKRFEAKFLVLTESVQHHIREEESEIFGRARAGSLDLAELGKRMEAAKASFQPTEEKPVKRTTSRPKRRVV